MTAASPADGGGRPVWMEKPRPVTSAGKALAVSITLVLVLVPFWVVVATSLSPDSQVLRNGGWSVWPEHLTFHAYQRIFDAGVVTHAVFVSVGVTLAGTVLSLAATVLLAYALARPRVFAGKPVMVAILVSVLFPPGMIPSFLIAQNLGLSLGEIERELARLPQGRNLSQRDWERISTGVRAAIDARIATLEKTREDLTGCIGCGCLSLKKCRLYNPQDKWAEGGSGPRVLR